ncbi:aldo/keto reductase [Planococcus shenhongbingii]|uniref:Aldo/keto reductase n=1 Tax=Planococcus shenhongbingii TaxID=3058398 RepID=A0ABT8NFS6_9BACL|nr:MULTISPECIES: aldo/keto reductase [unclassified Planococcus (in: firmicutes)]MDN7246517.1 aldo/keto reductase [Planococcus sp. N017]WKA59503.1 aldo/keto reductase [Planococcus sp. N016]
MKYSNLGRSGLRISNLSLGTMAFGRWIDEKASAEILDRAIDAGINLIDTANFYGKGQDEAFKYGTGESEEIIGRNLKGRRDKIVLATKVGLPVGQYVNDAGLSRFHIMREVENSLKRLRTDYIDLYQVHRFDRRTPLEETLSALTELVKQGKVRYIGCSNYAAWQMAKANGFSDFYGLEHFISSQSQYNLLSRELEHEVIPFCLSERMGLLVYSPMARGMLSGKYDSKEGLPEESRAAKGEQLIQHYFTDANFERIDKYKQLAEEQGVNLSQFSLAWILNQPAVTSAIVGASKPQHVTEAVNISDWKWPHELNEAVKLL